MIKVRQRVHCTSGTEAKTSSSYLQQIPSRLNLRNGFLDSYHSIHVQPSVLEYTEVDAALHISTCVSQWLQLALLESWCMYEHTWMKYTLNVSTPQIWKQPNGRLSNPQGLKWVLLAIVEDNIGWESVENRTKRRGQKRLVKYVNQGKQATA